MGNGAIKDGVVVIVPSRLPCDKLAHFPLGSSSGSLEIAFPLKVGRFCPFGLRTDYRMNVK
jgi:hypothetical protein